jgi:hypothetical protein
MAAERSKPDQDPGRIIRFKPRAAKPGAPRHPGWPGDWGRQRDASPVDDVGGYARQSDDDDYRHRMTMNVLVFLICLVLATAGVWLAGKLAEMRKNQDCVLSGRLGCTKVDVPLRER